MKRYFRGPPPGRSLLNPLSDSRNWEAGIRKVLVEPCDPAEDPLGYRAVFLVGDAPAAAGEKKSFAVGASMLSRRERHLSKAGYKAPMTRQAIAMIEALCGGRSLETV